MPCVTILVYLGNYLVYLYLFNLSTYKSSSPCGTYSERRDVILWRLISMREIRLTCRDHFSLSCCHALGVYSLKRIKFIAQWQATLGASPWVVDERKLRPVKGKSPKWQTVRFFTFAPNRAHNAGEMPTQGVASLRSPCPALWTLWAFSPSLTTKLIWS